MVIVADKVPDVLAVAFTTDAWSTEMETKVLFPKPEPITATRDPGIPAVGDSVILSRAVASPK